MISILDYGVGNLKNVYTALTKLGMDAVITSNKNVLDDSHAIVLPGVGAFKDAMDNLRKHDMITLLQNNAQKGKLIFGICLGMQLLFDKSYEDGEWTGLGLMQGEIVRFKNELKVPHMGWNELIKNEPHQLGNNISNGEYVYFVHSYYLKPNDKKDVIFYTDYGVEVPAVVAKDNIIGMQFHPEKSGNTGIKLLLNFKELIK